MTLQRPQKEIVKTEQFLRQGWLKIFRFLAEYRWVVYGLIMIAVILFRPEGIAGVPGIIQTRGLLSQTDERSTAEDATP